MSAYQKYFNDVLSKITTIVDRGERVIANIPQLIKKDQAGRLTPEEIESIQVDEKVLKRRYGITQAAEMAKISHTLLYAAEEDGRLPEPDIRTDTKKRVRAGYTINQINHIRNVFGTAPRKPKGAPSAIVGALNLKGGSQKTTTIQMFSQYLAMQGYRVLVLDTDPQGSLSFYFGKRPDIDVHYENTMAPFLLEDDQALVASGHEEGASRTLHYAIQKTYWDNIDIIPACMQNLNIDLLMTKVLDQMDVPYQDRIMKLRNGLIEVGEDYDYILVDGTPSLNISTLNIVSACDVVFVPTPAAMLDFASTLQFASMIGETIEAHKDRNAEPNVPDLRFFITKYSASSYAKFMTQIIRKVFTVEKGDVLNNECHHSDEIGKASTNDIGSIYEVNPSESDNRKRLKTTIEMFDALFGEMHQVVNEVCFEDMYDEEAISSADKLDEIISNVDKVREVMKGAGNDVEAIAKDPLGEEE